MKQPPALAAYSRFQIARKYFRYFLSASSGKGHGIHSPFVFDFVTKLLRPRPDFISYANIESLRRQLLADRRVVETEDFGAGRAVRSTIGEITRRAAKSKKMDQLLFRIAHHYRPQTIIELGSSLGISGAYLASGYPSAKLITLEGSPAIASLAKKHFHHLALDRVEVLLGNFDDTVPALCVAGNLPLSGVDLVFIDGNHRKEPTIRYFNQLLAVLNPDSLMILDDIHWSREMEQSWAEIKDDPRVMLTIDLFFIGLIFFRKTFKIKQHFTVRF